MQEEEEGRMEGAKRQPKRQPKDKQQQQQHHHHHHHRVGPWSWPRLALLPLALLLDAGVATVLFTRLPDLNYAFAYVAPGSCTWDLWLVALARCLLVFMNAAAFDAYALTRTAKRARGGSGATAADGRRPRRQQPQQAQASSSAAPLVSGAGSRNSPQQQQQQQQQGLLYNKKDAATAAAPFSFFSPAAPAKRVPRLRRLETWTRRLVGATSALSLVLVMSKSLVRLFCGIDRAYDAMPAFWLAVAWGGLCSVTHYFAFKQHVRQLKRYLYWKHHPAMAAMAAAADRRRQAGRRGASSSDLERDTLRESLLSSSSSEAEEDGREGKGAAAGDTTTEEGSLEEEEEGEDGEGWDDGEHDLQDLWRSIRGLDPEEERRQKSGHCTFADLLSLVRDDTVLIAVAFIFLLGAAVSQVLIPHYTGASIDAIVSDEGPAAFKRAMLLLLLCAFTAGICTGLRGGIFTVVGARVNRRLRLMLFRALTRQEIGFFDVTKTGDISSRLSADTTKVGDQVSLNVNFFLRNFVQAVGTLIFLFLQSWKLSLVAFVSVPAIVVISRVYGAYIRALSKATQEKLAQANVIAEEALSTMTTVRSFACEEEEVRLYRAKLDEYYGLNKREGRAYGAYAVATTLLPNLVIALVLYYGGQLVLNEDGMTSGKLVSFLLLLSSLSDAFNNMGSIFSSMTQALGAADKVFELIKRQPKIPSPAPPTELLAPPTCKGEIEIRDVVFRYPSRPLRVVLRGLSFQAQPGQVVALVGPSGGGKSSTVALLERFYEPEEGQVLLDGRPVSAYDHDWYHRHVSIVAQEPVLYGRSIRRNIIFGLEGTPHEPSEEDIRRAAVLANAHDFITALPDGYETECGERGVSLSGGQKQRIAIARALVRRPRVLLLDEATSALDAESEHQVQRAIDQMLERSSCTVCVVAHRLSTIINADVIMVIQNGEVVESGKHAELLARGGVYAQLVSKQIEGLDGGSAAAAAVVVEGSKQP